MASGFESRHEQKPPCICMGVFPVSLEGRLDPLNELDLQGAWGLIDYDCIAICSDRQSGYGFT